MTLAVIFDMDGVLSDTQIIWSTIETEILARYGITMTPEEFTRRYAGRPLEKILRETVVAAGHPESIISLIRTEVYEKMLDRVAREAVAMPGAVELVRLLCAQNVPIAVASGSPMPIICATLNRLGILDCFGTLVSGDEVPNGKPAPDIFLSCARLLGVEPQHCVVIEDGVAGMMGARAAGMACVALATDGATYPASIVVRHMKDVTLEMLNTIAAAH